MAQNLQQVMDHSIDRLYFRARSLMYVAVGGLIAAGDALQLYSKIPSASATILQGLLFVAALAARGAAGRRSARHE